MKHLLFIADLIEEAGLASSGVDLFVGTLPGDVKKGIMLVDPLTGHEIDEGLRGFFSTEFQAIVRNPDPMDGYALAMQLSQAVSVNNKAGDGIEIAWCRAATLPISYPRGDADDIETSLRFRIGFRLL